MALSFADIQKKFADSGNISALNTTKQIAATQGVGSAASSVKPQPISHPSSSGSINWGQQYQNILGRAPDAGGLAYWQSKEGSPQDILNTFNQRAQQEIAGRTPAQPANTGLPNLSTGNQLSGFGWGNQDGYLSRDEINAGYQSVFGRQAENAGLDYWYNQGKLGNVNEAQLLGALHANAQGIDNNARDFNLANNFNSNLGQFSTDLGYTWGGPGKLGQAAFNPGSGLAYDSTAGKWTIPGQQPAQKTQEQMFQEWLNQMTQMQQTWQQSQVGAGTGDIGLNGGTSQPGAQQPSNYMTTPQTFMKGGVGKYGNVAKRRGWGGVYLA